MICLHLVQLKCWREPGKDISAADLAPPPPPASSGLGGWATSLFAMRSACLRIGHAHFCTSKVCAAQHDSNTQYAWPCYRQDRALSSGSAASSAAEPAIRRQGRAVTDRYVPDSGFGPKPTSQTSSDPPVFFGVAPRAAGKVGCIQSAVPTIACIHVWSMLHHLVHTFF